MEPFTDFKVVFFNFTSGNTQSPDSSNSLLTLSNNYQNSLEYFHNQSLKLINHFNNFSTIFRFPPTLALNFNLPSMFSQNNFTNTYTPQCTLQSNLDTKIGDTFVKSNPVKSVEQSFSGSLTSTTETNKPAKTIGGRRIYEETVNGVIIKKSKENVNIEKLQPDMKEKLVALSEEAKKHGYTIVANSCYRSANEQANIKKKTPNLGANPNRSPHQYGCAFDLQLYNSKGKKVDIKTVPWFYNYAKKVLNLAWGQDWTRHKKESWHFERKNWNKPESDVYLAYCKNNNIKPKNNVA